MVSTRQMACNVSEDSSTSITQSTPTSSTSTTIAVPPIVIPTITTTFNLPTTSTTNTSVTSYSIVNDVVTHLIPQQQQQQQAQRSLGLSDLPIEILDMILSYCGFKKIAQLRLVSRQMNVIGMSILNSTFQRLQTQLLNRIQTVKAKMPRRESARRNHPLTCEYDIIETCYMRLSLLQMTFGKHIERKHCCFFPGGILDEVYNVLSYIRVTQKIARPFRVTDELFDLSTMAMEYFKEYIEPDLPEIGYFVRKDFIDFATNTKPNYLMEPKTSLSNRESNSSSLPSPPQSNMVLRKGIRIIKQGMKRYNNQLSVLRSELRTCKRKATEQAKQISDQQKLLAEQQKQTLEYANRLDENDKKNEEMSRKFSTMLQELNKCKTELQYWRSKSPATPMCTSCGQIMAVPLEDIEALANLGVETNDIVLNYAEDDFDDELTKDDSNIDNNDLTDNDDTLILQQFNDEPIIHGKRKFISENIITKPTLDTIKPSTITEEISSDIITQPQFVTPTATSIISESIISHTNKKIRRLNNSGNHKTTRCQSNIITHSNKTRSK